MIMVLGPHKKKSEAQAEVKAEQGRSEPPTAASRGVARRTAPPTEPPRSTPAPRSSHHRQDRDTPEEATVRPLPRTSTQTMEAQCRSQAPLGDEEALKVTGSGKLVREQANRAPPARGTSRPRASAASTAPTDVAKADAKRVKKLLGL